MPELPDIVVYLESLETRILGRTLQRIRLLNPFLLGRAVPPVTAVEGEQGVGVTRLGKRIVIGFQGNLFLVLHLMIARKAAALARSVNSAYRSVVSRLT